MQNNLKVIYLPIAEAKARPEYKPGTNGEINDLFINVVPGRPMHPFAVLCITVQD